MALFTPILNELDAQGTGNLARLLEQGGEGRVLRILGIRGLPAAHGGFETFAEKFAIHLVERGWKVVVYCQVEGSGEIREDFWRGIQRILVPVMGTGPRSTIQFDWACVRHAAKHRDLCLTLGYNTAAFTAYLRWKGIPNLINMDGIEWSRRKWGPVARAWLYLNERLGCLLGDRLIADHPAIGDHLATRVRREKITVIPYGAERVEHASTEPLRDLGLEPGKYAVAIARPEPENSILEMVQAWSSRPRGHKLVVLGKYSPKQPYHRSVLDAASDEVIFPGAIYEKAVVQSLRFHASFYLHGHQVGGTNPSLVEALGVGSPVLAHDNRFNRWVAGDSAEYFSGVQDCEAAIERLLSDPDRLERMRAFARARHSEAFTFDHVHLAYELLLCMYLQEGVGAGSAVAVAALSRAA